MVLWDPTTQCGSYGNKIMRLAPVALFTFTRLEHTKLTIESLKKNSLASETTLIIFSDAARTEEELIIVNELRNYLNTIHGFKEIIIVKREKNFGLAKNIIQGVSECCKKYGKVIVLEDDLITAPNFLSFMNNSLDLYSENKDVISISGCNYPADLSKIQDDFYFLRIPLCWGWATWSDRWDLFDKDISLVDKINKKTINYINFDKTYDFFSQAIHNKNKKINTWFIFWYIASATHKKLTLFPKFNLVENIGHDGSGENCKIDDTLTQKTNNKTIKLSFKNPIENNIALTEHKLFFKKTKKSIFMRIINRIRRGHRK